MPKSEGARAALFFLVLVVSLVPRSLLAAPMLAALAALAVSKNRFPTTRGASAPPPPPAGASRAGYPPAEEYARAQKEALARKYSGNATAAQPPPYIDSPSNAWKQIQQNTAWIKELDHG